MAQKNGEVCFENGRCVYYTAVGDDLTSIAQKTGVDANVIKKLNSDILKQRRIKNGSVIFLPGNVSDPIAANAANLTKLAVEAKNKPSMVKITSNTESKSTSSKSGGTQSKKSSSDKEAEKKRQNELKIQQYKENIKNAQEDYDSATNEENEKFSQKSAALDSSYKDNSLELESDMAKQKISESSIAENETKKLITDYENSKKQLSNDLEDKIEKLKNKLQRKIESENNKINLLS